MTQISTLLDDTIPALNYCDVGRKIKALRELVGISQRELARRSGLTNSSVSQIEQNHVSPSVQSLERLLLALQISLSDFFLFSADDLKDQPALPLYQPIVLSSRTSSSLFRVAATTSGVVVEGEVSLCGLSSVEHLVKGDVICLLANHIYKLSNDSVEPATVFLPISIDQN